MSANDEIYHRLADSMERARQAQAHFLEAWKAGIRIAGGRFFLITAESVEAASDKWQLVPNVEYIEEVEGVLSRGERAFLAAMVSFYNAEWGQQLLERAGFPNICDLAAKLDEDRAAVIASLFVNYRGW